MIVMENDWQKTTGALPGAIAPLVSEKPYLGDPAVVDGLVRGFVSDMMNRHADGGDRSALIDADKNACNVLAENIAGMHPDDYVPMPQWQSRQGLGFALAARLGLDPDQAFIDICRGACGMLALEIYEAEKAALSGAPDHQWKFFVDAAIETYSSLFLGTIDLTHPEEPAPG